MSRDGAHHWRPFLPLKSSRTYGFGVYIYMYSYIHVVCILVYVYISIHVESAYLSLCAVDSMVRAG